MRVFGAATRRHAAPRCAAFSPDAAFVAPRRSLARFPADTVSFVCACCFFASGSQPPRPRRAVFLPTPRTICFTVRRAVPPRQPPLPPFAAGDAHARSAARFCGLRVSRFIACFCAVIDIIDAAARASMLQARRATELQRRACREFSAPPIFSARLCAAPLMPFCSRVSGDECSPSAFLSPVRQVA